MTERKPNIIRLEHADELETLRPKEVVEIENIGEALFYPVSSKESYTFYTRWSSGKAINKITALNKNTDVRNGCIVIKGAESDLIWPHNPSYKTIDQMMTDGGI